MDKKTNFTSAELLEKRFSRLKNGYDPLEVDSVLDQIIDDYEKFESTSSTVGVDASKLAAENEKLKKEIESLKQQLDDEKNKWKFVSKDHKNIHIDNYELLIRIGKLEAVIYEKLHMNPDEIK